MRSRNVAVAIPVLVAACCWALPVGSAPIPTSTPQEAQAYVQAYALSSYCAAQTMAQQRDAQGEAQQKQYRELTDKWRRKHYEISIKLHHLVHDYAAQMVKEDGVAPEVAEINAWADILTLPNNMSGHEYASREFRRNPNSCEQP